MEKSQKEVPKKPDISKDTRELLKNFTLTRKVIAARKLNSGKQPREVISPVSTVLVIRCGWESSLRKELIPDQRGMA